MADTAAQERPIVDLDRVVIRFAGDSGDGMQLTGDRFTTSSALFGNDLSTLPDFPAEIRAPAGTLAGVSAFQVHISDHDILTPGDHPSVLVAMNPAALRANILDVSAAGTIIVNSDAFEERALQKAGYLDNPLTDGSLSSYTVYEVPMTSITMEAVKPSGTKPRDAERSKNFFALGLVSWLYTRPEEPTLKWIEERFRKTPMVAEANTLAYKAGWNFGETAELFPSTYEVKPAPLEAGTYTNISGNTALAWGLIAAGQLAKLPLFLGSYPITPASDILHELSKHKNFGVRTVQAEDEIAGIGAALGAAYAGSLGITTTSGPGVDLKAETIGLAVSLELPLLVIDIQRGGPSTGLPTKTEQADLLQAMFGRHGEAPVPIIAPCTPGDCFFVAIEAARIAVKYRTPVFILSDGYLANGAEPWRLPDVDGLPDISVPFATATNYVGEDGTEEFWPYLRDPETLGHSRYAGLDPSHRRIGESRWIGLGFLRPGQPRTDEQASGRQNRRHRRRHTCAGSRRPGWSRRDPGSRVGFDVWRHSGCRSAGQGPGSPGRPRPPSPPQPVPVQPRRRRPVLQQGARSRNEPGPASAPGTRRLPRRRQGPQQDEG